MNTTIWTSPGNLDNEASKRVLKVDSVLDVGCGIAPQKLAYARVHLCLDAYKPYLDKLMENPPHTGIVPICLPWEKFMLPMPDNAVDTVVALDFIEHLQRPQGERFLEEAVRIARKQVIVYTPLGFYPQDYAEVDRWGMGGGYWQEHLSGWTLEDFPEWITIACADRIQVDQFDSPLKEPFGAFYAIYTKRGGE